MKRFKRRNWRRAESLSGVFASAVSDCVASNWTVKSYPHHLRDAACILRAVFGGQRSAAID
jgi:hypothetical protein